ncbi:5-formyltetrahydrofolate cyclo-ligase [Shewanella maritima]|uniref:5-formyltetrahydrofolate cyclo-ligase n=1 Tax=Shewanella maritima TaxID=2520507 RepID=UPI00373513D4
MSITRFMTEHLPHAKPDTKPTQITTFSHSTEHEAVFDCCDMSRDSIRRHIRQERNSLSREEQLQLSLIASRHLLSEIQQTSAQHVALYLSNDGELDTKPIIEALWKIGVKTYLPVIHPFSKGNLLFLRYDSHTDMVSNRYGIKEPKLDVTSVMTAAQLDMIVTPLVAFDDKGNRMGMGGGYYDRTLSNLSHSKTLAVGFAHDCQQASELPVQYWDIPLPVIITPTRRFTQPE